MELKLARYHEGPDGTLGQLHLDGKAWLYTLEPATAQYCLSDHPAIPPGHYNLTTHNSPRFGRRLAMLENVPGRQFILVHSGNTQLDTSGCILVGLSGSRWPHAFVTDSRMALDRFNSLVLSALDKGQKLTIGIQSAA